MICIVPTPEQSRHLEQAKDDIELVDEKGKRLGIVAREIDLEDIRIARQRLQSDEPRYTYADVLEHLRSLEAL